MYCTNCGAQNSDTAQHCINCGNILQPVRTPTVDVPPPPGYGPQAPVPNNLVWAILTTLFCCLPFGIVSIVYAAQVDGKAAAGDRAGALESARKARMWALIAFGSGLVVIVLYLLIVVIGAIASSGSGV